jgi:hypothetical protein
VGTCILNHSKCNDAHIVTKQSSLRAEGAHIRDDFVARIEGRTSNSIADTPLQKRIDEIREGFLRGDSEAGNGGAQVLETLVDFCKHSYPKDFSGVREYLDYRFEDIANGRVKLYAVV